MKLADYHEKITGILAHLAATSGVYEAAAEKIAETVQAGHLVHVLGSDMHTSSAADEVFFRFGSLAAINPMYDPSIAVNHNAARALYVKNCENCGTYLVEYYRNISRSDVLIIIDNDGTARFALEAADKAAEMGVYVIAITSKVFTDAVPKDCAFIAKPGNTLLDSPSVKMVIDNGVPAFDALDEKTGEGWVSTIANSFVLNALILSVRSQLKDADVWGNFYEKEGALHNQKLIEQYISRIKHI